MAMATSGSHDDRVAGLIVGDGDGHYFVIGWDDLRRYRVPEGWAATVAAVVHGAEPSGHGDDLWGHADTVALSADHALLKETIRTEGGFRLGAQRLEAWALLR